MSTLTTNDFMKMGFAQACMKAADIAYELEQSRAEIEALKQQVEQGKLDAEISRRVVEMYERIETPFDKILTSDQRAFLFDNEYELKYIPMYADQPDPTYIKEWFWEIRDKHGASVTPASVWLYTAINVAMTKAAIAAAPKQEK